MTVARQIVFGALAGLSATMAMTATMRTLHQTLPTPDAYPLPPREITDTVFPSSRTDQGTTALLAHFAYGALTGALYAVLPRNRAPGVIYGPLVWAASYFGWIPASGVLRPAHHHPLRRNALMILAHAVWGAALSAGLDELDKAAEHGFGQGPRPDALVDQPSERW
jgi:hypothetical protein